MKWLMLCREPRLYSCCRIKAACEAKGIELDILDPNRMLLGLENGEFKIYYQAGESYDNNRPEPVLLPNYDGILPRFGTGSTEMGCSVLRHFEAKGIPVLNHSAAFALARDKWRTLQKLAKHNLPVPNTNFAGHLVSVKSQLNQFAFPLISKVLNGSQGNGVMLFEGKNNAEAVLATFRQVNEPYLCQQFVGDAKGQDIRAFVIGNEVVAAMSRTSVTGDFRANIHQGGTAQPIELTQMERALAIKATKTIGLDIAGVDFLRTEKGVVILEVNASPGFEGIERVNDVDIASEMVSYFINKMKNA
ncbi:TPA: ATP-grasp domain-containing protein [Mannheimia haemolytica]|uniref:ATP-grasp domain-containing protein n=1 Tax=Mannheimia haemolytica TaxID=75985 RepID=UPI0005C98E43|nr:RimK family alpha-L-glutamate ligase [Mannheimia haemolytica]KIX30833.1 ribosomal protein S6 modification protein [Mannheimia haemolytica]MCB4227916.1 RimK family alpha-L-glutamate ligase [Mannheimia haemolytica]MEE3730395.1 RimK family alpha-L-glutamate ligase [Mannheimia haemolytica]UQX70914.1 RimK family alpha-L-glutamate ligase [Mannheimia haemolytica]SQE31825.1 Alpha-aminoadipate--lysW ligase lysX [Mannheimia haemolytica]